jgi:hypothetical protein
MDFLGLRPVVKRSQSLINILNVLWKMTHLRLRTIRGPNRRRTNKERKSHSTLQPIIILGMNSRTLPSTSLGPALVIKVCIVNSSPGTADVSRTALC